MAKHTLYMGKQTWGIAMLLGLLASLFMGAASATPVQAQAGDPLAVANAFIEAINKRDGAAMRSLAAPDFTVYANQGTRFASQQSLEQYVAAVRADQTGLKVLAIRAEGQTVVASVEFTGSPLLARLPNPATATLTFTFAGERISRLDIVFSEQTLRDLETLLGQPLPTAPQPTAPQPTAQPQAEGRAGVVLAFIEAINMRDTDAMRRLAAPDFVAVSDLGGGPTEDTLDTFIASFGDAPAAFKLVVGKVMQNDSGVVVELRYTGIEELAILPNPFTTVATFTVLDGRVARMVMVLSEQTRQDLEDLRGGQTQPQPEVQPEAQPETQPGMPRTGGVGDAWLILSLITAIGSAAGGIARLLAGRRAA